MDLAALLLEAEAVFRPQGKAIQSGQSAPAPGQNASSIKREQPENDDAVFLYESPAVPTRVEGLKTSALGTAGSPVPRRPWQAPSQTPESFISSFSGSRSLGETLVSDGGHERSLGLESLDASSSRAGSLELKGELEPPTLHSGLKRRSEEDDEE
jgi:hypothetical protein